MELFSIRIQRTFQLVSTADGIYRNVPGLPAHVLAEKIYRNELVELADDEIHILDLYTSASVGQLADSWQDYKKNNLETETGK